jgi:hypothetical protein
MNGVWTKKPASHGEYQAELRAMREKTVPRCPGLARGRKKSAQAWSLRAMN